MNVFPTLGKVGLLLHEVAFLGFALVLEDLEASELMIFYCHSRYPYRSIKLQQQASMLITSNAMRYVPVK